MNRIQLFSFFCLFLWLLWPGRALQAANPTSVELISFDLIPLNNAVQIEWVTATELNTAGFMVQRGSGDEFEFLQEIGFIISEGGPQIGASYEVVDETAVNGETYTYKLIEFEQNSSQHEIAAETVTVGIIPTATGIIIGGGGQNPPPATPTIPGQTATPSPTANTTAVSTPTAVPTTITLPTVAVTAVPTTQPTQTANPQNPITTLFQAGVASAQEETPLPPPQAVAQVENTLTPTTPDVYPVQPAQTTAEPNNPTPYPAATSTFLPTLTTFPVVGSNIQLIPTVPAVTTIDINTRPVLSGIAFLWGGFILAFFIFITAVLGSIHLFTRRRQ